MPVQEVSCHNEAFNFWDVLSHFFILKVGFSPSKKVGYICFNENPLKVIMLLTSKFMS